MTGRVMFDSGVSGYIKATATVSNFFPVDRRGAPLIVCEMCRFYRRASNRCGLTEEVIPWADKYVGRECPLEEIKEEE